MKKNSGTFLAIVIIFMLFFSGRAIAASAEEERTAVLVEGAKKEGKVVWYTTMATGEADALFRKFNEKYPFLVTEMYRAGNEKLLLRALGEAQAKKYVFDVAMPTGAESQILLKKGLFTKYLSPQRRFYPEESKDSEGYWTDLFMNLNVIGYNTKLVSPRDVPKTYEELLASRWKGKMALDTKAYEWFANVVKLMGEKKGLEYMKKLGEQNIQFRTGRSLNAQMVAAGEVSLAILCFNQRIEEMKEKGAPVNWIGIEPIVPELHPLSISAHAPHPNGARLFLDYALSKEGQTLLAGFHKITNRTDVELLIPSMKKGLKILPPDFSVVDDYERYAKLYRELLMRK